MYTVKEAAKLLGVSESRVRNMICDGVLQAEKFGRSWAVSEETVQSRLNKSPRAGRPPKGSAVQVAPQEPLRVVSQPLQAAPQPLQAALQPPQTAPSLSSRLKGSQQMSGAQALVKSLEAEGVEYIFGYPGGNAIDLYDALYDSTKIKHILVRHEQGATHGADGYARSTGRPGVVLVTSGPGATNTVTGIATAYMDSIPLIVIAGQVPTHQIGTDAFQEADTTGITLPIVKHSYLVKDPDEIPQVVHEAFHLATTGRQGPVVIDIPCDVARGALSKFEYTLEPPKLASYKPTIKGNARQIKAAADLIWRAYRPVLYVGGGVVAAGAYEELLQVAEQLQIPVACTLMARGAFPQEHPLYIGQPGIHGASYTNRALHEADLIIAVGARFSDRVTGNPEEFAPTAQIIHIDIDPAEIGKNRACDVPIVGDAKAVLAALATKTKAKSAFQEEGQRAQSPLQTAEWLAALKQWKSQEAFPEPISKAAIMPGHLMKVFAQEAAKQARRLIVTTEVGQHQMWACQYIPTQGPRSFITSGGLGTMGFGLPAALGAQLAHPDALVVCISGDGSLQMNSHEMATAAAYGLPVKVLLVNNNSLGMVRQMQELFYDQRFAQTEFSFNPDFVVLAKAYGWEAHQVSKPKDLHKSIEQLLTSTGPALLEVVVPREALVLPMSRPEGAVTNMLEAPLLSQKGGRL